MITVNRSAKVNWKLNTSIFEQINRKAFNNETLRIGSHLGAVNTLSSQSEFMRRIMPSILGKDGSDKGWQGSLADYLHNFSLEVPKSGKKFNTSYTFDIDNDICKERIEEFIKEYKPRIDGLTYDAREKVVLETIQKRVSEENLYKYVNFVSPEDYIAFRYLLLHNVVANSLTDINKSNKIQFYFTSEQEEKEVKAKRVKLLNEANKYYNQLLNGDIEDIENIIIANELVGTKQEFDELDEDDMYYKLVQLSNDEPAKFLSFKADTNIQARAEIRKLIWAGLLTELTPTTVIVDAVRPDVVIGNNMTEAISYMHNEKNKAYINELLIKYKAHLS